MEHFLRMGIKWHNRKGHKKIPHHSVSVGYKSCHIIRGRSKLQQVELDFLRSSVLSLREVLHMHDVIYFGLPLANSGWVGLLLISWDEQLCSLEKMD